MKKKFICSVLASVLSLSLLASCNGSTVATTVADSKGKDSTTAGSAASTGSEPIKKSIKILSIWAEDNDNGKLIIDLTDRYIAEVNPNFSYEYEVVAADNLKQKIAVLAASNDLPDVFVYESGKPIKELIEADKILDIGGALESEGVMNQLDAGAVSLLKTLSGTDKLYDLPLGLNVEGFWYNKALFEKAGVSVPKTWTEFQAACAKLEAAGIQPLVAGGADKWPLTRLINAYVYRSLGVDAMKKAAAGEVKYTDPGYVAAAKELQDMAKAGYFGEGITTIDQGTAGDMLMAGQAAMFYNGSWFTQQLNAETNPAGAEGIGFFNVPVVDEKISAATEYSMNCGNILCLDKGKYDDGTAGWLKYFVENIGNEAMSQYGSVKGYTYTAAGEMSDYTKVVANALASVTKATTWFEAAMNSEVNTVAQTNVQTLVNGDMTPEEYMQSIQDAYDSSR